MQPVFVAELQLIGARSCHGAAPVRILVSTKETGGMMVIICFERDKSLFLQSEPGVMRWPVVAVGDSRIRVGDNLASDHANIGC